MRAKKANRDAALAPSIRRATRKGMTLIELLAATTITLILLFAILPMMSTTVRAWHRTSHDTATTMDITLAMRRIASELRYAKETNTNTSGTQLNYVLPNSTSANFRVENGNLVWSWSNRPLLRGIVLSDPQFGGAYPPFQMAYGANNRAVIVRLCVRVNTPAGIRTHRLQQLVVLRNRS